MQCTVVALKYRQNLTRETLRWLQVCGGGHDSLAAVMYGTNSAKQPWFVPGSKSLKSIPVVSQTEGKSPMTRGDTGAADLPE